MITKRNIKYVKGQFAFEVLRKAPNKKNSYAIHFALVLWILIQPIIENESLFTMRLFSLDFLG